MRRPEEFSRLPDVVSLNDYLRALSRFEKDDAGMRQLLQTNDPVLISFVEDLLRQNGINAIILDRNMSVLEGSIGVLQRRVMVIDDELVAARRILTNADLGEWLKSDDSDG